MAETLQTLTRQTQQSSRYTQCLLQLDDQLPLIPTYLILVEFLERIDALSTDQRVEYILVF